MKELRKQMALAYASKMGEQLALLPVEKQLVNVDTMRSVLEAIVAEKEIKVEVFGNAAEVTKKMAEVVEKAFASVKAPMPIFGSARISGGVLTISDEPVTELQEQERAEVREFKKLLHVLNMAVHSTPGNHDEEWAAIRAHYNRHLNGDGNPATSLVSLYIKAGAEARNGAMRCLKAQVASRTRAVKAPKAMATPEFHATLARLFSQLERTGNTQAKARLRCKLRDALNMVTARRSLLSICEAYGASDNAERLRAMHHVLRYLKHFSN